MHQNEKLSAFLGMQRLASQAKMDGNDAMKLLLPAAGFAIGVGRLRNGRVILGMSTARDMIHTEVTLLLYFWPRLLMIRWSFFLPKTGWQIVFAYDQCLRPPKVFLTRERKRVQAERQRSRCTEGFLSLKNKG